MSKKRKQSGQSTKMNKKELVRMAKEIEEAGKELAKAPGGAAGAPKGPSQALMDKQEKDLKSAALGEIGLIIDAAKKKKEFTATTTTWLKSGTSGAM